MKRPTSRTWLCIGLLFGLACLYNAPLALIGLDLYDEGIRLSGAERVLAGETPYHDFYGLYGPAQFYVPALLFRLFGAQIVTLRFALLANYAMGAVSVFSFSRAAGLGPRGALLSYVLFLLPSAGCGMQLYLCDPALVLILIAGTLLVSREGIGLSDFLAGILVGGATLFRQDFGVYGLIAGVAAVVWRPRFSRTRTSRRLILIVVGMIVVSGTGYGLLALRGVKPLFNCLIRYPSLATSFRRLPYPASTLLRTLSSPPWAPSMLVYLAPPVTLILLLALIARGPRRRLLATGRSRAALVFLIALALGLSMYGFGRCDFQHLFPLYVVCIPLCLVVLRGCLGPVSPSFVTGYIAVGVLVASATFANTIAEYLRCLPVPLVKAQWIVAPSEEYDPMIQASAELRAIGGSEPIFVACDRHDRVYINPMTIYFLAGRLTGSYFAQFDPGITTTREVQQRIIDDLRTHRVRLVVVYRVRLPDEPNKSRASSGVTLLDDYFAENFSPIKIHPEYSVLSLKE